MTNRNQILTLAVALVLTAACSRLEKIEAAPKSIELKAAGQSETVQAKGFDQNGKAMEGVEFAYASTNAAVATVDATGKVTAVKSGSATIEVSSKEKKEAVTVEVRIPAKITFGEAAVTLTGVGASAAVSAKVFDDADRPIEGATVTFAIADDKVASIADGKLTAVAPGATKLGATLGTLKAEADVTVALPAFEKIEVEPAAPAVKVGEKAFLTTKFKDAAGGDVAGLTATFTSSDAKIATVENGQVTGVAPGKATITVASGEKTAAVVVTVAK